MHILKKKKKKNGVLLKYAYAHALWILWIKEFLRRKWMNPLWWLWIETILPNTFLSADRLTYYISARIYKSWKFLIESLQAHRTLELWKLWLRMHSCKWTAKNGPYDKPPCSFQWSARKASLTWEPPRKLMKFVIMQYRRSQNMLVAKNAR